MPPLTPLTVETLEDRTLPVAFTSPALPTSNPAVLDNARYIFALGQELGRRPDAFMKVGDSNSSGVNGFVGYNFLTQLGLPEYNPFTSGLPRYGASVLQTLITFRAPVDNFGDNSFDRESTSAFPAWTVPIVTSHIPGELAATDASLAFIMIGTNDLALNGNAATYRTGLQNIVQTFTSAGVLPVLSTLPDHVDNPVYESRVAVYNQVVADVGAQYDVPVWNLWASLQGLPNKGLLVDGVHLDTSPAGGGDFSPISLEFGQNVRNLEALQILDWFRTQVVGATPSTPQLPGWTPLPPGAAVYAVGGDVGQQPVVSIYDTATGRLVDQLLAYEPTFTGGVKVAVADVNGDGVPDIVTGPGRGGGPVVKVFSGATGELLGSVMAFEPWFRTGVNVAAADLNGDGKAEVVVGAGNGGGPAVAVFAGGNLTPVSRFFAFDPAFRGGVTVAATSDLAGVGPAIVAGAGVGGGPVVEVYRYGIDTPVETFFAYDPTVRTGVNVAAGNLAGTGTAQIATAPVSGSPNVRVFDPITRTQLASFFAGPSDAIGGARVAVSDGNLVVGNGPGEPVSVGLYPGLSRKAAYYSPNMPSRGYGTFVG